MGYANILLIYFLMWALPPHDIYLSYSFLCDFQCPSFFPAATITWKFFCCFLREIQGKLLPCLCLYLLLVLLHQEWLKNGFLFLIMSKNSTVFCVFVDNFLPVLEGNSFPFRFADCFFFFFPSSGKYFLYIFECTNFFIWRGPVYG